MAISATFTADFSQFIAATEGAQQSLSGVETASKLATDGIEAQSRRATDSIVGFGRSVATFAGNYIGAFADSEAATGRLTSALEASGNATPAVIAQYQAMGAEFQRTTRYSNDAVTAAQAAFTEIGRIGPEQMQPAIQAAADLAARLKISLPEAAAAIATVIGSDGAKLGILKKYLTDVDVSGKSAGEVLDILFKKFGGSAARDIGTTAGEMERFNNQLDDFKSKVGGVLASAFTPLLDAFARLDPMLQTIIAGGAALVAALAPVGIAFGAMLSGVTALVTSMGGWGVVLTAIEGGLGAIAAPAAAVVAAVIAIYEAWKHWDAITGFVKAVYDAVKTFLVDGFNQVVEQILAPIRKVEGGFKWLYDQVVGHSYVPDMMAAIGSEFSRLDELMVKPAQLASDATAKAFDGAKQALGAAMQGGVQLPGSRIEQSGFQQYLISPEGYRVPMERTATGNSVMPANWWAMYTGRESSPLNSMFTGTELATAANNRPPPVNVTINGSVLSTQDQMATMVQDAMMQAYRQGGNLLPV